MAKQPALTLRMDAQKLAIFTALCALNRTTASDVLREAVEAYIDANKDKINMEAL